MDHEEKKGLILRQEFAPVLPKSELIPTRQHCVSYAFEVNRRCKTWLPQLSPVAFNKADSAIPHSKIVGKQNGGVSAILGCECCAFLTTSVRCA